MSRITEFRELLGISRKELAKRVGVDRTMMWRYEKGKSVPSDKVKIKIAKELGRSVEEIFFSNTVAYNTTTRRNMLNPTGTG